MDGLAGIAGKGMAKYEIFQLLGFTEGFYYQAYPGCILRMYFVMAY
jgi:hypothetical protein